MRALPLAALSGVVAIGAAIPAALGDDGRVREVSMPGKTFAPGRMQVLIGDTVVWRNGDATNHTATANDDSFDSGYISPGATFSLVFAKAGQYAYHCSIHKFMRGVIVVVPVALQGPAQPVVSGGRVVLQGLAPTGTSKVVVERRGKTPEVVQRVTPAGDGSFTVTVHAARPEVFAARVRQLTSTPVLVAVSPRVKVRLRDGVLTASVRPLRAGAGAVLQRYERERFAWRTVSHGRVDSASHVSLRLPARSGRFRIVIRGGHGWADGASPTVVRRLRK
jgi:plastocyanin